MQDQLSVQQAAVFDLLYSHGRIDEALYFAGVSGDISRIVRYYISQKEYDKALAILSEHHSTHLFELNSPELLIHDPKATVDGMVILNEVVNGCGNDMHESLLLWMSVC